MVQHINLLNPALLPKAGPLPPQRLLGLCAAATLACLALSGGLSYASRAARAEHASAAARYQAERTGLLQQLASVPVARKPEALAEEAKRLADELTNQQQWLERLQAGRLEPAVRHSALLRLLATQTPAGVWLSALQVDSAKVQLEGQALQASAVRDWVSGLNQSPYFEGRPLDQLKVERLAPEAGDGGGARPARVKFQLGTTATAAVPGGRS